MQISATVHIERVTTFGCETLNAPGVGDFTVVRFRGQPDAELNIIARDHAKLAELRDAIHDYLVSLQPAEAA